MRELVVMGRSSGPDKVRDSQQMPALCYE